MDRTPTCIRTTSLLVATLSLAACPSDDGAAVTTTTSSSTDPTSTDPTSAGPTTQADTSSSSEGTATTSSSTSSSGVESGSSDTTTTTGGGTESSSSDASSSETTTSGTSTTTGTETTETTGTETSSTEGAASTESSTTGAPDCASEDLGVALPASILVGTQGAGDDFTSCAGPQGVEDVAVRWTAPAAGDYFFTTNRPGTVVTDTVLSVRDGDCDGPVIICDDDIAGVSFRSLAPVTLAAGQSVIVVIDGYGASNVGAVELYVDAMPAAQPGGGCCSSTDDVGGCDAPDIEACVCSFLPECCDDVWSPACVLAGSNECRATCSCVEFAGCDAPSGDCICQGCNLDGICNTQDDCIGCPDCEGSPFCGCNDDGVCEPFNENCACADCADEDVCA